MIKIIFVCLGNICRSPLAEAICKDKLIRLGWQEMVSCDSAGTAAYHLGADPDSRSIQVAHDHNIAISHKGQQFTKELASEFDYWLAMDASNFRNMIIEVGGKPKELCLMRQFDDNYPNANVSDPYYGGDEGFEEVYQVLDHTIDNFLLFVKEKHNL